MSEDVEGVSGLFGISAEALAALLAGPPDPLECLDSDGPRAVAENKVAREAFRKLALEGIEAPGLSGLLRMIEALVREGPELRRAWTSVTSPAGMTKKQLHKLPERIRRMADDIGRVNKAGWYSPDSPFNAPANDPKVRASQRIILREFRILPGVLQVYAQYLEILTRKFGQYRRGKGRKPPLLLLDQCVDLLIVLVRSLTKRPHWGELADILGALGFGGDNPPDENSLRMWHKAVAARRKVVKQLGA
jgi:hypothetical protein